MNKECFEAGAAAYAADLPCREPSSLTYKSHTAAWRLGWKKAAAQNGDRDAFYGAMVLTEQRRSYGPI